MIIHSSNVLNKISPLPKKVEEEVLFKEEKPEKVARKINKTKKIVEEEDLTSWFDTNREED